MSTLSALSVDKAFSEGADVLGQHTMLSLSPICVAAQMSVSVAGNCLWTQFPFCTPTSYSYSSASHYFPIMVFLTVTLFCVLTHTGVI